MKLTEAVKQTPPKILLFGQAGTWKSTFSTTWGSKSQVLDLDKGLKSALMVKDKWTEERHKIDVVPCYSINPTSPSAFETAKRAIFKISQDCAINVYPFKILIIDSLTALGEESLRMILRNGGKIDASGKILEITQREWGLAINELENLLTVLRSLPIVVIVIAHELVQDVDQVTRIKAWALGSKLPDKLPTYFDEVWYARVTGQGDQAKGILQTRATSNVLARSRGCLKDMWEMNQGLEATLKEIGYT